MTFVFYKTAYMKEKHPDEKRFCLRDDKNEPVVVAHIMEYNISFKLFRNFQNRITFLYSNQMMK
jgi:hypothetical protein